MRKLLLLSGLCILLAACNLPQQTPTAPPASTSQPEASPSPLPTAAPTLTPSQPSPLPPTPTTPPTLSPTPPEMEAHPTLASGQPVTITQIRMTDLQNGWAVASLSADSQPAAHILRTADGGQTWLEITPPVGGGDSGGVNAAMFQDALTAWVLYSQQVTLSGGSTFPLWLTRDGGLSWSAITLQAGEEAEFFGAAFFAADASQAWLLLTVGAGMNHAYSNLYHSADNGQTWTLLVDPFTQSAAPLMGMYHTGMAFHGNTGWVTKENGVADGVALVMSTDGGQTWEMPDLPSPLDEPAMCSTYAPVLFTDSSGAYLVRCWAYQSDTQSTFFAAWQDGQVTYTPLPGVPDSLIFFSPLEGLALGCADLAAPTPLQCPILATSDGGHTWQQRKTVNWDGQFSFVDSLHGWAVARDGEEIALVYTTDGGGTWQLLHPIIH